MTDDISFFPAPIVSAEWLAEHRQEVAIADVRWSVATGPKFDDFESRRIADAVFVDLDVDLSDPSGDRGRHPLPTVASFRETLRRLELIDRPVVCYDDASGATAARLWWMLQALGLPAAVLDGGIDSWNGPWDRGPAAHNTQPDSPAPDAEDEPTRNHPVGESDPWPPDLVVPVDRVLPEIAAGTVAIDARSSERFAGEPNPLDQPAGHIPGGRNRPWTDNVGADGRLHPPDELKRQFAAHGLDDNTLWMASCGSGVTACHNLLAAAVAGLPPGRLYAGSWSEWIRDPARPIARSIDPTTPGSTGGT
jgi:thiosulfate/3-mercaptopyruvate sulfurtransferase